MISCAAAWRRTDASTEIQTGSWTYSANGNLLSSTEAPTDEAITTSYLYDQSQLNRHFRRIVGKTPGQYARSV